MTPAIDCARAFLDHAETLLAMALTAEDVGDQQRAEQLRADAAECVQEADSIRAQAAKEV